MCCINLQTDRSRWPGLINAKCPSGHIADGGDNNYDDDDDKRWMRLVVNGTPPSLPCD